MAISIRDLINYVPRNPFCMSLPVMPAPVQRGRTKLSAFIHFLLTIFLTLSVSVAVAQTAPSPGPQTAAPAQAPAKDALGRETPQGW
ncbi:MAG: hypothetical protein HC900_13210 [Methylacidiphilales bacterium]|nr:hypothetical protein [Candidatus Methylacidiphilales bacterium]